MEIESSLCKGGALTFFTFIALFHTNYIVGVEDVVEKKKAWVFSTTIRERDKKNAECHSGDYQDKNGKCLN